ncbi:MAG: hypothetical protein WBD36_11380 [Bacteroidota bacterium]
MLDQAVNRVAKKLTKRYGPNTALVVRNASPIPWNWDNVKDKFLARLDLSANPFDMGIWILDFEKSRLHEIARRTA